MANDFHIVERPTISMARFHGVYLVVHPKTPPSDSDWKDLIAFCGGDPEDSRNRQVKVLVYSDGGGPNAAQRRQMVKFLEDRPTMTAVLTASTTVRAIVTAFGWFRTDIRAFAPHDVAGAAGYLGLRASIAPEILERLNRMLARWGSSVRPPAIARTHSMAP